MLQEVDVTDSNLFRCLFIKSKLKKIDFSMANNIKQLNFYEARITLLNFENHEMTPTVFHKVKAKRINFSSCNLFGSNFRQGRFVECQFDEAKLGHTVFTETEIKDSTFINAQLRLSKFNHSILEHCDFTGANVNSISLHNVNKKNIIWDVEDGDTAFGTDKALLAAEEWTYNGE
jgi:uncharacterized protein YjbI with pentapeptide repeats